MCFVDPRMLLSVRFGRWESLWQIAPKRLDIDNPQDHSNQNLSRLKEILEAINSA